MPNYPRAASSGYDRAMKTRLSHLIVLFAVATVGFAAEAPKTFTMSAEIPFDPDVAGDLGMLAAPNGNAEVIKAQCNLSKSLGGYMAHAARDKKFQVTSVANTEGASGPVLRVSIEGVMGYMGVARGPKVLTVRGELRDGEIVIGSFVAREETHEFFRDDCKGFNA